MEAGTVLRKWREARGLTQEQLGCKVGISAWTERSAEGGRHLLAPEVVRLAARVLGAAEIAYAACDGCPANLLLNLPENVDTHPVVQLLNTLHEAREAVAALEGLDLRNKTRLEGPALVAVERAVDQLLDLVPAVAMTAAVWSRQYGLDLEALHRRHRRKLELKGYRAREGEEAGALPRFAEGVAP